VGSPLQYLVAQATLAAYVDTFRMLALLCLACLPAVLLLGKARSQGLVAVH